MPKSTRTKTDQERFWEGEFGVEYTARNAVQPSDREPFFQKILEKAPGIQSACELGANRGHNLLALKGINPNLSLTGVDLNPVALKEMATHAGLQPVASAIQDFEPCRTFDLVYICGVLIHLNPDDLPAVYRKMAVLSSKYVLISEYYNPTPVEIDYRGHAGKLFKRDFGGEFMDANAGKVKLVDYGFLWQRVEPAWDNNTWWLFEKL